MLWLVIGTCTYQVQIMYIVHFLYGHILHTHHIFKQAFVVYIYMNIQ